MTMFVPQCQSFAIIK